MARRPDQSATGQSHPEVFVAPEVSIAPAPATEPASQPEAEDRRVAVQNHPAQAVDVFRRDLLERAISRGGEARVSTAKAASERKNPRPPTGDRLSRTRGEVAPSRVGKISLTVWLPPIYKEYIRHLQARHVEKTIQGIFQEALDDLFRKYEL